MSCVEEQDLGCWDWCGVGRSRILEFRDNRGPFIGIGITDYAYTGISVGWCWTRTLKEFLLR